MPPALPPPPVRTLLVLAAPRRKIVRVSEAGGRPKRWAHRCPREVPQVLPRQPAEPALAPAVAMPAQAAMPPQAAGQAQAAGLVRERSSLDAAQRAAAQLPGPGAARHNPLAPRMRRWRLLKE